LQSVFLLHEPEDRTMCARPHAARERRATRQRDGGRKFLTSVGGLFVCAAVDWSVTLRSVAVRA
jgi:hypothetical protein